MDEDIKKLIEENIKLTQEMNGKIAKISAYIKWVRVMDIFKILLIVLPIIAAWIYLPTLLDTFNSGYGELFPGLKNLMK